MIPIPSFYYMVSSTITPVLPGNVKQIAIATNGGEMSSIAVLLNNNKLYTQGWNRYGECATGTTTAFFDVLKLAATDVKRVFGGTHIFIIEYLDGSWKFCGGAQTGAGIPGVGNKTTWTSLPTTLTSVVDMANIKAVSSADGATLWLQNNGDLYGQGGNTSGQLGNGTNTQIITPRKMNSNPVTAITAIDDSCGFLDNTGVFVTAGQKGTWDICCAQSRTFYAPTVPGGYITDFCGGKSLQNLGTSLCLRKSTSSTTDLQIYLKTGANEAGWNYTNTTPVTAASIVQGTSGKYIWADGKLCYGVPSTTLVREFTMAEVPINPLFGATMEEAKLTGPVFQGRPDTLTNAAGEIGIYDGNLIYRGNLKFFGVPVHPEKDFMPLTDLVFVDT